ncbi:MAG: hypothetical protein GY757_32290 [bacterium]|nr:hypothetical protein [bacterium]
MKIVAFVIGLLLLIGGGPADAKTVPMHDVFKPHFMSADKTQLYICQRNNILIYSLKDFKIKNKFGKLGEGPKEFLSAPRANAQTRQLIISSPMKLSLYSKNGEYIREVKTEGFIYGEVMPLNDLYVGMGFSFAQGNGSSITIYNSKMKKEKAVFSINPVKKRFRRFSFTFLFRTNGKNLFVAKSNDLNIDVFDKNLNKLNSITKKYSPPQCTKERKRVLIETFDSSPKKSPGFYERLKKQTVFPDYFPAIRDFTVADGKVYVQTYRESDEKSEFLIFDENGTYLKTVFLPGVCERLYLSAMYTIQNNKLYSIIDNVEEEMWELHVVDFK